VVVASDRLPDLIITEVVVPHLDGLSIIRLLRDRPNTADLPIVVVTGMLHDNMPQRARDVGAAVVLPKPTSLDALVHTVDDMIRRTPSVQLVRRHLRQTLLTIATVAAHTQFDQYAQVRVRAFIDRLQIAVLAFDDRGRHVAASAGVESLTGYSRAKLLAMSIYNLVRDGKLPNLQASTQDLITHELPHLTLCGSGGTAVPVDALVTTIVPGLHAAAFSPIDGDLSPGGCP
jgi:DNA-binding response OmpR family regulator